MSSIFFISFSAPLGLGGQSKSCPKTMTKAGDCCPNSFPTQQNSFLVHVIQQGVTAPMTTGPLPQDQAPLAEEPIRSRTITALKYKRLSVWTVAQSVVAASLMSQPSVSKERTNLSPQEPTCQTQLLIESAIFSEHHDTEQIVDRFRDCNSRAHPRG